MFFQSLLYDLFGLGSYQIYAMKGISTLTQTTSTSGNVLLRWWDAFPKPISSPASISAKELATLIRKGDAGGTEFAIIDVRKDDHAVSFYFFAKDLRIKFNKISYFREAMFEAATMLNGSLRTFTLTSLRFSSASRTRLKSFFIVKAQVEGQRDALLG